MSAGHTFERRGPNSSRPSRRRWIPTVGLAGVLGICLLGCGGPELTAPESPKETPPAPPVATASLAPTDHLWDEVQKVLDPSHRKQVLTGGAVLLTLAIGLGVGKILRGSPPRPDRA